jgi:hypothetical protein
MQSTWGPVKVSSSRTSWVAFEILFQMALWSDLYTIRCNITHTLPFWSWPTYFFTELDRHSSRKPLSGTRDIAQGTIYFWTSPQPILLTIQKTCPNDEHFLNSYASSCGEMARMINNDSKVNIGNLEKPNTQEIGIPA